MKIKIRTKEGEFVADFPHVIEISKYGLTRLSDNGIQYTEVVILEWHGYEIIEQVSDDAEVTYPVEIEHPITWQFKLFNLDKNEQRKES